MDPEIQFGEVEHVPPQSHLRPDRNRHYAVVGVYDPDDTDLPIFVDLDVMRDMEAHALSDTSVELGGVLLGGQFADDDGRPFVMITDSLRAQHYESTKGSFKFTHDTWERITREREEFPAELQMVGWYHTHPGWGVFLSGMDMFICENFFNKPLDVALVIDPCRHDRGFFQWQPGRAGETHRTGGFYLVASRFRLAELQSYATQLQGARTMSHEARYAASGGSGPVINFVPPSTAWQSVAMFGMLTLQFCFLMLIAWRLVAPPLGDDEQQLAAQAKARATDVTRQREAEIDAKLEVLELVVRQGSNAPQGILKSLADQTAANQELRDSLRGQQSLNRELDGKIFQLEASLADAKRVEDRQSAEIAELKSKVSTLRGQLDASETKLAELSNSDDPVDEESGWWSDLVGQPKSLGIGAVLGALAIGAALVVAQQLKKPDAEMQMDSPKPSETEA